MRRRDRIASALEGHEVRRDVRRRVQYPKALRICKGTEMESFSYRFQRLHRLPDDKVKRVEEPAVISSNSAAPALNLQL